MKTQTTLTVNQIAMVEALTKMEVLKFLENGDSYNEAISKACEIAKLKIKSAIQLWTANVRRGNE